MHVLYCVDYVSSDSMYGSSAHCQDITRLDEQGEREQAQCFAANQDPQRSVMFAAGQEVY